MFEEARSFNQPLNWDVSNVTDMSAMFYGASSFNQPLNHWGEKVSNVATMGGMLGFWKGSGGLLEGFWHVAWGGSRPLRRGRRVRGPRRGVSGGVEVPFEGQAAVLRSLLKCKV